MRDYVAVFSIGPGGPGGMSRQTDMAFTAADRQPIG